MTAEQGATLALSDRLALEEPTLPGMDQILAGLRLYRRELLALLLAVLVHVVVLALGFHAPTQRVGPTGATALSVSFSGQRSSGPAERRAVLLAERGVRQALTTAVPVTRPRPQQQALAATPDSASHTLATPAPPALVSWWQYASASLDYYAPEELDVRSQPVAQENFLEGLAYRAPPGYGQVEVRIYINANGGVDRVEIQQANPPGVFEQITLQQLYQLRFSPAQKDGLFVKSFKDVILTFDDVNRGGEQAAGPPPGIPAANGVPSSR